MYLTLGNAPRYNEVLEKLSMPIGPLFHGLWTTVMGRDTAGSPRHCRRRPASRKGIGPVGEYIFGFTSENLAVDYTCNCQVRLSGGLRETSRCTVELLTPWVEEE